MTQGAQGLILVGRKLPLSTQMPRMEDSQEKGSLRQRPSNADNGISWGERGKVIAYRLTWNSVQSRDCQALHQTFTHNSELRIEGK